MFVVKCRLFIFKRLSRPDIKDYGVDAICSVIKLAPYTSIDCSCLLWFENTNLLDFISPSFLTDCDVGMKKIVALCEAIRCCRTLTQLDLSSLVINR